MDIESAIENLHHRIIILLKQEKGHPKRKRCRISKITKSNKVLPTGRQMEPQNTNKMQQTKTGKDLEEKTKKDGRQHQTENTTTTY